MRRASATTLLVLLSACRTTGAPERPEVTVAAAANIAAVFQKLGPRFEAETGIHPVFRFASTAQLARQIENSAPFDAFAAAAADVLALWIPPPHSNATVTRIDELTTPSVRVIAVAKPELAPYGHATMETLQNLRIICLLDAFGEIFEIHRGVCDGPPPEEATLPLMAHKSR